MATSFLTDPAAWVCFCATRLAELGGRAQDDCEALARDLYRDEVLGHLDPVQAAERHVVAAAAPAPARG